MSLSKNPLGALCALGACILLVWVTAVMWFGPGRFEPRVFPLAPGPAIPAPIVAPEVRPSYGLAWSRRHYPQQYTPSNRYSVRLSGEDDPVHERYMDAGNRAYSREFLMGFSYSGLRGLAPDVRLTYLKRAETFVGKLAARGLKPNFAYQLKLRGVYADRESFERIGYLGRWRLPGGRTNFTDDEYGEFKDKERAESYLLFDFVVTDSAGNAEKEFYADSSLHVLWNVTYQKKRGESDTVTVNALRTGSDPLTYANPNPDLSAQWVFGENEGSARKRVPVGMAVLPSGHYRAEFVLTEESFHGYADGGFWATVMKAPVEFDVVRRPRQSMSWKSGSRLVKPLSLDKARKANVMPLACVGGLLEGVALTPDPTIMFSERIRLPARERYYVGGEAMIWQPTQLEMAVDPGPGFEGKPGRYGIALKSLGQWQRFEVEVTSRVAGKEVRLFIKPALRRGFFALRKVGIYRIAD